MFRLPAHFAHAALAKLLPIVAFLLCLFQLADGAAENELVQLFVLMQTFTFIAVQPGYLETLRSGEVFFLGQIAWLILCVTLLVIFLGNDYNSNQIIATASYGLAQALKSTLAAVALRTSFSRLIVFESMALAVNLSILIVLWWGAALTIENFAFVLSTCVLIEAIFIALHFSKGSLVTAWRFSLRRVPSELLGGFIVLAAAGYGLIIVQDVSETTLSVAGVAGAAFSATYIARTCFGLIGASVSNYIISSTNSTEALGSLSMLLVFVLSLVVIMMLSYCGVWFGVTYAMPQFMDLLIMSIFFAAGFLSSVFNAEIFRISTYWSATSGVVIASVYFGLKGLSLGSYQAVLIVVALVMIAVPLMILRMALHK